MFASQTFFLSLVCFSVFVVGGVLLGFAKVFSSRFPQFYHQWDVKPPGGISFNLRGFHFLIRLMDLELTPSFVFFDF